jgi:SNF2 family DNA or RNA helicase
MTSALVLLLRLRQACNHPHLLAGKIHKDKDSGLGLATPRKKKSPKAIDDAAEDDALAGLMGGLSVDQRKCEVCITDLTVQEIEDGEVRCTACNENLEGITKNLGREIKQNIKILKEKKVQKRRRPTVFDSDDEEDDKGSQAEEGSDTEEDDDDPSVADKDDRLVDSQAEESSGAEEDDKSEYEDEDDPYSQLLPSTKISSLLGIIQKEMKEKNKIIVFSQFTSMLDLIEPFLRQNEIAFTRYDGSMKNDDREASLRRLRGEGEFTPRKGRENWCGVLLCSLKCGALGLNLTCASRVVILEPFWNPVGIPLFL